MSYFGGSRKQRKLILDRARAARNLTRDQEFLSTLGLGANPDWDDAFDHLNTMFWNGQLKKIPVAYISLKKKKAYGFYHGCGSKISLANDYGLSAKQLLGVLLHEMCHHSVHLTHGHGQANGRGGRVIGHGKEWKAEMRRVGYTGKITKYRGSDRFC